MAINLKDDHIAHCLSLASHVSELYGQRVPDRTSTVKSIGYLQDLAEDLTKKPIQYTTVHVSEKTQIIKGFYLAREDYLEIVILEDLNDCWERFVLCKELFHAFIDCDEYRNMDLKVQAAGIYPVFAADPAAVDAILSVDAEYLAEIAAIEFLLPFSERKACLAAGRSTDSIAEQYKIPAVMVDRYCLPNNMAAMAAHFD
ncbi:ImmA/IrrE family metallo-endopeptidase [Pigmentiphaga litoralis]|uniref:IrrE N-terminal-like domain-containing protein n=1 Tax=Pigmentiphaga litoralis TaxID=516702 RepID=A0A7Y9IY88_9BURK|nr:ImmA/IrrE family metallo-endopeptidase [Pigmentiphaga litoralis]NYE26116.1 hypothetical protein [Pigmentiphaga litoralis]NYE85236.1 hypothetical protein [Pigmentiphaga litoralis]